MADEQKYEYEFCCKCNVSLHSLYKMQHHSECHEQVDDEIKITHPYIKGKLLIRCINLKLISIM